MDRSAIGFFALTPRLNRVTYLGLFSLWFSIMMIGVFAEQVIGAPHWIVVTLHFLLQMIGFINLIFAAIRRLNDFDYSGWWLLFGLVPIIGWLWLLAIFIISGSKGSNRFGDVSRAPTFMHYLLMPLAPITYYILHLLHVHVL